MKYVPALLTVAIAMACFAANEPDVVVVADLSDSFSVPDSNAEAQTLPTPGWQYQWNPTGVNWTESGFDGFEDLVYNPTGAKRYRPAGTSSDVEDDPNQGHALIVKSRFKENQSLRDVLLLNYGLGNTKGQTGGDSTDGFNHGVHFVYTIQPDDPQGVAYHIDDLLVHNRAEDRGSTYVGLQIRYHDGEVSKRQNIATVFAKNTPLRIERVKLGSLSKGDRIYFLTQPAGTNKGDVTKIDFTITAETGSTAP